MTADHLHVNRLNIKRPCKPPAGTVMITMFFCFFLSGSRDLKICFTDLMTALKWSVIFRLWTWVYFKHHNAIVGGWVWWYGHEHYIFIVSLCLVLLWLHCYFWGGWGAAEWCIKLHYSALRHWQCHMNAGCQLRDRGMKDMGKIKAFKPTQNIADTIRIHNWGTMQHRSYWNSEGNLTAILNQQCIKNNIIFISERFLCLLQTFPSNHTCIMYR